MNRIYSLIILSALAFSSCGDFLEPKSESEYSPKEVTHLSELILGQAVPGSRMADCIGDYYLDLMTDDVVTSKYYNSAETQVGYLGKTEVQSIKALYTWQPQYAQIINDLGNNYHDTYERTYVRMSGANAVIDWVDKVSGTAEEKDYVLAQALALRAFYNLYLVNIYGTPYNVDKDGLGIPLKLTAAVEDRKMTRNTVGEVYDAIIADLLQAERLFKNLPAAKQFNKSYRPTMPMVQLLLARTYLYMEDWDNAAIYADKVIADWPGLGLMDYNQLIAQGYHNNAGAAVVRKYYTFVSYDNPEALWVYGWAGDYKRFSFYLMRRTNNANYPNLVNAAPDLVELYEANDIRNKLYLVRDNASTSGVVRSNFMAVSKVRMSNAVSGNNRTEPLNSDTDFGRALRMSEAYVISAEAHAMRYLNGNGEAQSKAVASLNELRSKRYVSGSFVAVGAMSADELVEFAREERRREMCFEGLRWADLRRWGMPEIRHSWFVGDGTNTNGGQEIVYVLEKNDPGYILPLTFRVLGNNSNLKQTELYGDGTERAPIN